MITANMLITYSHLKEKQFHSPESLNVLIHVSTKYDKLRL